MVHFKYRAHVEATIVSCIVQYTNCLNKKNGGGHQMYHPFLKLIQGGGRRGQTNIKTYEISPKGRKASFKVWVSISGLRSPTNMWQCSENIIIIIIAIIIITIIILFLLLFCYLQNDHYLLLQIHHQVAVHNLYIYIFIHIYKYSTYLFKYLNQFSNI